MQVRVIERDRIEVKGLQPIVLYGIQISTHRYEWVEIARTTVEVRAEYIKRAIEFYEERHGT